MIREKSGIIKPVIEDDGEELDNENDLFLQKLDAH